MGFRLQIDVTVREFDPEERERWRRGERGDCTDPYCLRLPGTYGFGEYLVGRHFAGQGYQWIHHDFDLFGLNRPNKYPDSEAVLLEYFGFVKLGAIRKCVIGMKALREQRKAVVEAPDLLIYRSNPLEVKFAECKLAETRDKLNRRQLLGFMLIGAVLRCPIDVFVLRERGKSGASADLEFVYPFSTPNTRAL